MLWLAETVLSWVGGFFFSRFVAAWPSVRKEGNRLIAKTGWKTLLWNLGSASKRLEVDPVAKTVRLQIRRFWLYRTSRRLEFDWIQEIAYRYAAMGLGIWAYREADLYTIELQLKNGEHVMLFRFFGEGDFINNSIWPDWMYWNDFLVAKFTKGDQENQSMMFADLLGQLIGVPISNE